MIQYFDKNGTEIKEGDTIRHDNGEEELVYACGEDGDNLGVNASNEDYLKAHPEAWRECYPLSQFDLREWEVVKGVNNGQ